MLDIVIPVYNEGEAIIEVLETIQAHAHVPCRVMICYDHDDDTTLAALKKWKSSKFEVLPIKNKGRGAHGAVMTGYRASTAEAVMLFPGDDTTNGPLIDKMFAKFKEGYDIVCPSRFMPGGSMVGCPWLKAILVRLANFTLYYLARLPTRDASNGFRFFSKKVINEVPIESTEGFTYSIEYLVKWHRRGGRICEVPAQWVERKKGQSRFRVIRWLPAYLRWYFYAFATTFLGKKS